MSTPSRHAAAPSRLRGLLPAALVLMAALFGTTLTWELSVYRETEAARTHFVSRVDQLEHGLRSQLASYEAVLSGGVGLFAAAPHVTRQQWHAYLSALSIDSRLPGVLGIGFSERIPARDLAAHQQRIRSEGFPEYAVTPVGKRDEYHSIVYLEPPNARNIRALGFDLATEPIRRTTMDRARDTGLPTLSGKVTLMQETSLERQTGCLLYLPVYRPGADPLTVQQRREALRGFVYAPIRMADLMQSIRGRAFPDLDLEVFDGSAPSERALLYRSPDAREDAQFTLTRHLVLNGLSWTLRVRSRPEFEAPRDPRRLHLIGFGGVAISVLLFAFTWSLASTRARAQRLAQAMTRALRESEARFRAVHDFAAFGIVQTSPDGRIRQTNPAFQQMVGYTEQELRGMSWSRLVGPEERTEIQRLCRELLSGERPSFALEHRYLRKDGRIAWGSIAVTSVKREDGALDFLLAVVEDISRRKQHEREIEYRAFHDALTGLPNRMLFADRLDQALTKAQRNGTSLALMFLDLDHFKEVNDAWGHKAGDSLLQEVARRLRGCVRASDTVARIGGDEFVVLLPSVDGEAGAVRVAEKILQVLPIAFPIGAEPLTVTPSIGISLYPDHAADAETLIKLADDAMYASKKAGRNRATLSRPVPATLRAVSEGSPSA